MWWSWEWEQHSDDAEVILTQHADDFIKGDHEFRFGVQYSRGGGSTKTFNPDYYYQREYEYYPGYPYVYQYCTRVCRTTTAGSRNRSGPLSPTAGRSAAG